MGPPIEPGRVREEREWRGGNREEREESEEQRGEGREERVDTSTRNDYFNTV